MQAIQAAPVAVSPKFASTNYEDHTGMLHTHARKGWGRLEANGVTVEYGDVFQHMCESFLICQRTYDPSTGFSFGAYYGRSIWNNFNKWAERLIEERQVLGMVSLDALSDATCSDSSSVLEFADFADDGDDSYDSPEDIISARQQSHNAARMLTPTAKRVVALLVHHTPALLAYVEERNSRMLRKMVNINLWTIMDFLEVPRPMARALRIELGQVYGIEL
jgi:hypothetical protein